MFTLREGRGCMGATAAVTTAETELRPLAPGGKKREGQRPDRDGRRRAFPLCVFNDKEAAAL